MGKPCFSKAVKFFAIALFGAAATIAAVAVLSSPATAQAPGGGGGFGTLKPWDTDNLAYGSYSARNFRVPFHQYGGYSGFVFSENSVFQGRAREACQSAIADGFFQSGGSVGAKNDFPVLDKTASGWRDAETGSRSSGCGDFVANQHLAVERANAVGGFYLDIAGNLQSGLGGRVLRDYGLRTRSYTHWTASGSGRTYAHTFVRAAVQDGSILASVRPYGSEAYSASRVVTRSPGSGYVGIAGASSSSAVDAYLARTDNYRSRVSHVQPAGGQWLPAAAVLDRRNEYVVHWVYGGRTYSRAVAHLSSASDARFLHSRYDIGSDTNGTAFCPAGMHPRGQDGSHVIGSSTGRTLSSINTMPEVRTADRHWCRTDVRYKIAFKGQIHKKCDSAGRNPGSGTSECRPPSGVGDPRDGTFQAFGRINCYYTVIEVSVSPDGTGTCVYPHPLPQCTDPVTRRKRSWTQTELGYYTVGEEFPAAEDGSTRCNERVPARAADFASDPCVTIGLDIYENRTPGEPAAPGVALSDRTRTATDQMPGWDLGVSAGHFDSASPLLDTTGSDKDPSGCADGTESRGDHGALPASAERTNSQASAPPLRSAASDTAHPPHRTGDTGIVAGYDGVRKNLAHRYASRVAENTCSVKKAEAQAHLELLKQRAAKFSGTASSSFAKRYHAAAQRNETDYKDQKDAIGLLPAAYPSTLAYPNGYWRDWYNTNRPLRLAYFTDKETAWKNLKNAIETARAAHETATDAAALTAYASGSCVEHWDGEIRRLANLFSDTYHDTRTGRKGAGKAFLDAIEPFETAAEDTVDINGDAVISGATKPPASNDSQTDTLSSASAAVYGEEACSNGGSIDSGCVIENACPILATCPPTSTYRSTGTRYRPASQSGTHSAVKTTTITYNGNTRTVSTSCSNLAASRSYPATGWFGSITWAWSPWGYSNCPHTASNARSVNQILGTPISLTGVPAPKTIPPAGIAPPAKISFDKPNILRTYHPQNPARTNLKAELANDRNTASASLSLAVNHHPNKKARDWRDAYKTAYDNANRRALADLGGTNPNTWTNLNWQYHTPYLRWDNYQEDPATTYSASTSTPRNGTGCDIAKVATDGSVSVEATRLDYETSQYGKGNIYSTRTPAQRTCKIRRTRTPELNLQYQPPRPTGTDTTKTATFWHINYQPTTTAERHKLTHETEVFAIRASLADSPPVLCYQPGEALIAHVAAKGIDAVNKAVFRHASGFAGGNKKHCYRHPTSAQLGTPPKPAFVFFDDTAHSAMASVNVVWQQPTPKIVSKLGSTDHLKMMANTVSLVASNAVAYDDATRTSSFYGTYYTFPTDTSVKSPSGWDITGHPTLTLASTFTQHQVQAKDTAAKTPTTHAMVFKFVDCVFGIEDVAFVDNIESPYALLSKGCLMTSNEC